MMMTAQVSSPSRTAEMTTLSVKRPSLATSTTLKKRKLSSCSNDSDAENDDEAVSPTSLDELTAIAITTTDNNSNNNNSNSSADESSVISPKKKARAESSSSAPVLSAAINKWESSDAKPQSPSAVYSPIAFDAVPAAPLDAQELEILNFFLA